MWNPVYTGSLTVYPGRYMFMVSLALNAVPYLGIYSQCLVYILRSWSKIYVSFGIKLGKAPTMQVMMGYTMGYIYTAG